jgi:hypothetical protein
MGDLQNYAGSRKWPLGRLSSSAALLLSMLLFAAALPLTAREKDNLAYGEGLIVNIPLPPAEVEQVVAEITQNGVIRGTKEYNKDEFISGAKPATSSHAFPTWTESGKVFYKIREHALDPRNFKDGGDVGTLAVRYVVQPQGAKNTVLRIDAVFEEDFRHTLHPSNGSVESNEYKDVQEHLEAIEVMKQQNVESEKERQEQLAKKRKPATPTYAPTETAQQSTDRAFPQNSATPSDPVSQTTAQPSESQPSETEVSSSQLLPSPAPPDQTPGQPPPGQMLPGQSLEDHVKDLRQQVERLVRSPGAPLKSAPFHTASTLQTLNTGAEVLILISTPYWYGIETHEGQHGWVMRDQLEQP